MPVVRSRSWHTDGFQKIMETIGEAKPVLMSPKSYDYSQADTIVNVLYKFQDCYMEYADGQDAEYRRILHSQTMAVRLLI